MSDGVRDAGIGSAGNRLPVVRTTRQRGSIKADQISGQTTNDALQWNGEKNGGEYIGIGSIRNGKMSMYGGPKKKPADRTLVVIGEKLQKHIDPELGGDVAA
ncbi:hypothetical protein ZHAS_00011409 [Anopheles sinensis]|uniref:Uncharacterized protein n=1 Tax=Anopheles sinensis TaxID=74873 RepID=A0A084W0D7_ANOSI|nr:hypothetical protein ZHAS_00011409 [Anopheles sinensis]